MIMKKLKNNPWEQWFNEKQKNIKYPTGNCYDSVKDTSKLYPNYKAYNYFGVEKNYSELITDIDNIAKSLHEIGVNKGDYVTICSSNVPEAVICFYAVNKIGAIANMIHPKTSLEEFEYFLNLTKSNIVIAIDSVLQPFMDSLEKTDVKTIISFGKKQRRIRFQNVPNVAEERFFVEFFVFGNRRTRNHALNIFHGRASHVKLAAQIENFLNGGWI